MKILYINNDGGGFADHVEVEPDTTVAEFFRDRLPDREPGDFLIRVNRQPVLAEQVLQADDRISITPTKIEGACSLLKTDGAGRCSRSCVHHEPAL